MTQQNTPKEAGMRLYVYFFISLFSGKWRLLFYGNNIETFGSIQEKQHQAGPGSPPEDAHRRSGQVMQICFAGQS